MRSAGIPITTVPFGGPLARTFTSTDPDGYRIARHDRAWPPIAAAEVFTAVILENRQTVAETTSHWSTFFQ
ncbi:MAG: hypothetical protein JWP66_1287 [Naasia sp.]|nr:hypothetical protein [Naasia sp.]